MNRGKWKLIWHIIKQTFKEFNEDNVIYYSASLSYYTIFSLPPIIIIIISLAGALFGKETVSNEVYAQFESLLGQEGKDQIISMVEGAQNYPSGLLTKAIGIGTLLFASTGVFIAIQSSLNVMWEVKSTPKNNVLQFLKDRLLSFGLIISLAFLLLISLVIHALLVAFIGFLNNKIKISTIILIQAGNFIIPLLIVTLLFAIIFKFLPDVKIRWKDVWIGSAVTSTLFTLGKFLIGIYLGNSNIGSAYGAAGTVILILIWVFYSSILLFLGAEFTQVFAKSFGHRIEPADYAVKIHRKTIESRPPKKTSDRQ